jgi:hypothetical protein
MLGGVLFLAPLHFRFVVKLVPLFIVAQRFVCRHLRGQHAERTPARQFAKSFKIAVPLVNVGGKVKAKRFLLDAKFLALPAHALRVPKAHRLVMQALLLVPIAFVAVVAHVAENTA